MARSTNPAIEAQARYVRACDLFEQRLDEYLDIRARGVGRHAARARIALAFLQSAKRIRLAAWAAYQAWGAH